LDFETAMNRDIEQLLGGLKPRGVGPELRPRVLAAVQRRLIAEPASPWLRRASLAVAASLLAGIAMNVGASVMAVRRMAQILGPAPVPKQVMELAEDVEQVADAQTAQWVCRQFASARPRGDGLAAYAAYNNVLSRLTNMKDPFDETPQKDSQMDRDRPRRAGGDRSDCQRPVRLDHRFTA
jgi:hypothetical protein